MSLTERLFLGEDLVRRAGPMALSARRDNALAVQSKGPGDLVSAADFAIETMVRDALAARFPQDGLIGEEYGRRAAASGFTWLVDPVDGTVNYARGLGYFCISLALLRDGDPVAAWILDPLQDELFHAGPDRVMRVNGAASACSSPADIRDCVVGLGFSSRHDRALFADVVASVTGLGAEFRRLGAGALCLAHVAAGRLDAYIEPHMNPWDAVGGLYLAACAGAITGQYLEIGGIDAGGTVYAAAPALSPHLLARLPAPFSGTPLHRENDLRSAGETANTSQRLTFNVET